nr:PREDICTED: translation initiation factor IF-2-like [Lepisosteus oculatus]
MTPPPPNPMPRSCPPPAAELQDGDPGAGPRDPGAAGEGGVPGGREPGDARPDGLPAVQPESRGPRAGAELSDRVQQAPGAQLGRQAAAPHQGGGDQVVTLGAQQPGRVRRGRGHDWRSTTQISPPLGGGVEGGAGGGGETEGSAEGGDLGFPEETDRVGVSLSKGGPLISPPTKV